METRILHPGPNDAGKRIDRILRVFFPEAGLGALFAALRRGDVRVNGKKVGQNYRVGEKDLISVKLIQPFFSREVPVRGRLSTNLRPERMKFHILYEDENLLAINKPWGALTHGPHSLDEAVKAYLAPLLPPSLAFSPAPVHRLDRNTSGLIFFSKSIEGARSFTAALRSGETRKVYYALLEGRLDKAETWADSLRRDAAGRTSRVVCPARPEGLRGEATGNDKAALTEIRPLAATQAADSKLRPAAVCTLCEVIIHTGRTHQIRAQAAAHGHPLAGDSKYGGRPLPGAPHGGAYILHAAELVLPPPADNHGSRAAPLIVRAPLPEDVREFLERYTP